MYKYFYIYIYIHTHKQHTQKKNTHTHLEVIAPNEAAPALHTPFSKLSTQVHLLTLFLKTLYARTQSQNSVRNCIYYIKPPRRGLLRFFFCFLLGV